MKHTLYKYIYTKHMEHMEPLEKQILISVSRIKISRYTWPEFLIHLKGRSIVARSLIFYRYQSDFHETWLFWLLDLH